MKQFNSAVEKHYSREGLYEIIVQRLKEHGIEKATREDIATVDEFHVRGAGVSLELAAAAGLDKNSKLLDVGCGIGGPCRMLADKYGCKVTGIDATGEFIRTAKLLSDLLKLGHLTTFVQGDALHLPFKAKSFDAVWTQHVQMNIENKQAFYSEINRVLVNDGRFIYYDIFKKNHEPLYYPLPWADDESQSFLFTTSELSRTLNELGFTKVEIKDQTTAAMDFFTRLFEKIAREGASAAGLDLLMGADTGIKMKNLYKNILENKVELQSGVYYKG